MPEQTQNQKDMDLRLKLFSEELDALQKKYLLRIVAQMVFPGGAMLNVPITAYPLNEAPVAAKVPETASKPE